MQNLCLAGGVALNCVANGKVLRDGAFENIWIQPAAGDAGGALGAALAIYHLHAERPRTVVNTPDAHGRAPISGPSSTKPRSRRASTAAGARFDDADAATPCSTRPRRRSPTARPSAGSRADGVRPARARQSLDPRRPARPDHAEEAQPQGQVSRELPPVRALGAARAGRGWFDLDVDSPYMLLVAPVAEQHTRAMTRRAAEAVRHRQAQRAALDIPAVTHVDYSARVQTVHRETNPLYHDLISRFHALTGCPVLVNTSFNVRSEPIVCTPEDAFRCFMGTEIDMLVVGNCDAAQGGTGSGLEEGLPGQFRAGLRIPKSARRRRRSTPPRCR